MVFCLICGDKARKYQKKKQPPITKQLENKIGYYQIPTCTGTRNDFYKHIRKKWIEVIFNKPEDCEITKLIDKGGKVCSKHFVPSDFSISVSRPRLLPYAVPKPFLDHFNSQNNLKIEPDIELTEIIKPLSDKSLNNCATESTLLFVSSHSALQSSQTPVASTNGPIMASPNNNLIYTLSKPSINPKKSSTTLPRCVLNESSVIYIPARDTVMSQPQFKETTSTIIKHPTSLKDDISKQILTSSTVSTQSFIKSKTVSTQISAKPRKFPRVKKQLAMLSQNQNILIDKVEKLTSKLTKNTATLRHYQRIIKQIRKIEAAASTDYKAQSILEEIFNYSES